MLWKPDEATPEAVGAQRERREERNTVYREELYNLQIDHREMWDAKERSVDHFDRLRQKLDWWNEATDREGVREVKDGMDESKKKKLRDLGYIND